MGRVKRLFLNKHSTPTPIKINTLTDPLYPWRILTSTFLVRSASSQSVFRRVPSLSTGGALACGL
ncbi:hypothetical protein T4A_2083 [Trichinella pseudospiralis]|uniref:Uncharacterized protein n=1 Tax=Trichinella pseudospiralis TaxID=6337 RepID=A0A0V1F0X5_TRIPS|nr:hypothetical protein T4E_1897 [Trichinella pseudospiralis]KRY79866.1 hypothetical protein T4A_2083 [Trichinella pseudospiralis]KRZ43186.1 hypothetical protein T4C_8055 [Trichinella pseudospiralis]